MTTPEPERPMSGPAAVAAAVILIAVLILVCGFMPGELTVLP